MSAARETKLALARVRAAKEHLQQSRYLNRLPPAALRRWELARTSLLTAEADLQVLEVDIHAAEAEERAELRRRLRKARAA